MGKSGMRHGIIFDLLLRNTRFIILFTLNTTAHQPRDRVL